MRSLTQKLVLLVGLAGLAIGYQNCSAKHTIDEASNATSFNVTPTTTTEPGSVVQPPATLGDPSSKLQLGDQVMRSLSALTGVPVTNGAVVTEYNLRAPSMAGSMDPSSVTSPLMVAVTDLASVYCNTIITTEQAQTATARRLFGAVDFTLTPTAASYNTLVTNLAQKFWGRAITPGELAILTTNFTTLQSQFAANVAAATKARTTALFACTAMLSVYDVLTF